MTGNTYYSTAFPAGQEFYAEKWPEMRFLPYFLPSLRRQAQHSPEGFGTPPYARPIVGSDPQIAPWIIVQVSRRHPGMPPYAKPIVGSDGPGRPLLPLRGNSPSPLIAPWSFAQVSRRHLGMPPYATARQRRGLGNGTFPSARRWRGAHGVTVKLPCGEIRQR